jgi:SAM-dependent methyltransferase
MARTITKEKRDYLRHVRELELDAGAPPLFFEFVAFLDRAEPNFYHENHYFRYCRTFRALLPYLPNRVVGLNVLETGGISPLTQFLATLGAHCAQSRSDLRYSIDAAANSTDLILCLEVIEHLKDRTEETFDELVLFQQSGARSYAAEVWRVLRPGGLFVFTTPNPCSTFALQSLIAGRAPMVTREHVREYTREELHQIFDAFELVGEESHYSFFYLTRMAREAVEGIYAANDWSPDWRGDDHFMVFRKTVRG